MPSKYQAILKQIWSRAAQAGGRAVGGPWSGFCNTSTSYLILTPLISAPPRLALPA